MGEQTRKTLREFFKAGQLPTEEHFGDLIDSMLNMKDEGFRKSPLNGLEVAAAAGQDALLSFYRDRQPGDARWALRYGKDNDQLQVQAGTDRSKPQPAEPPPALLSLDVAQPAVPEGRATHRLQRVGINIDSPRHTLDVAGVLASQGRMGSFSQRDLEAPGDDASRLLTVPADGVWHPIVDKLVGCHAFEVMAGVGGQSGSGRFALLHAVALNTHNPLVGWLDWLNPKRGIRATSAHYASRCDQLQLAWDGKNGKGAEYSLCVRTRCPYDAGVNIRFAITRLWFDPLMDGCQRSAPT